MEKGLLKQFAKSADFLSFLFSLLFRVRVKRVNSGRSAGHVSGDKVGDGNRLVRRHLVNAKRGGDSGHGLGGLVHFFYRLGACFKAGQSGAWRRFHFFSRGDVLRERQLYYFSPSGLAPGQKIFVKDKGAVFKASVHVGGIGKGERKLLVVQFGGKLLYFSVVEFGIDVHSGQKDSVFV